VPPEILTRKSDSRIRAYLREPQIVFAPGEPGGSLTTHPAFADLFGRVGLTTASTFLQLPGEVVSGHPDRHVMRITIPGAPRAFYLKRQHIVGWREKVRNRLDGFGYVSRCEREAELLQQLDSERLHAPRWAAFGTYGRRAFLLVEEVPDAVELRRILSDNTLSLVARRTLAMNIGTAIAALHTAGFSTPDLSAKHVLVNRNTFAVTLLDWQSATRRQLVRDTVRADEVGALHASLAESLATPSERLRALAAYRGAVEQAAPRAAHPRQDSSSNIQLRTSVLRAAARHARRRSVRDQLPLPTQSPAQRLVWLAEEAVCAIPEIAAVWPRPAITPPFYGFGPLGASQVRFAGRDAVLVRGHTTAPFGRLGAWLRATPWRSPGVTIGRILFHLERYGVPTAKLFAFGQRLTSVTGAEWFALYQSLPGIPLRKWRHTASFAQRRATRDALVACVQKLHDASCVLRNPKAAFVISAGSVYVADPRAVRIVRRVTDSARRRDLRQVFRLLGME